MAIRAAESAKGLRSEREHPYAELPSNGQSPKTPENGLPKMTLRSPRSPEFLTSADADEFTRVSAIFASRLVFNFDTRSPVVAKPLRIFGLHGAI